MAINQATLRLCVFLLWISGTIIRCGACGPDFPNWLLSNGDNAVLRTPEAWFGRELQRMRLITSTNVARVSGDPRTNTIEIDLADLRKALEGERKPSVEIDSVLARHRTERWKLHEFANAEVSDDTNTAPVLLPIPQVVSGLPPEFADYFRGAIAWHQTNFVAARAEWAALLKRPASERHYRSTWAAFMLGKSWETEDPAKATACYRRVRELAHSGCADSLGLAVESIGWEARLEWQRKHYAAAIDLYLEQYAAGDKSAENSLRFVARDALHRGRTVLDPLARHPRAQRLMTAFVISGGYRQPAIDVDDPIKETGMLVWAKASSKLSFIPAPNAAWHVLRPPAILWLEAVESAKVRDVDSAEQLALAAYQAGEMEIARRWLDRSKPTPVAQWLRAKLCFRDGKLDEGTELLAKVAASISASATPTNSPPGPGLADSLFLDAGGEYGSPMPASTSQAVQGELAVTQLAHRHYVETLDSLMHSSPSYWMDAAYVAERVLSLEELKGYVDRELSSPKAEEGPVPVSTNSTTGNQPLYWPRRDFFGAEGLRYLLARRLARSYRFAEARPYYPTNWLPLFEQLSAAWQIAEDSSKSSLERGQALVQAAVLTRKYGLELIGTEVEPDWRIHQGDFTEGVTVNLRASLRGSNLLAATSEEVQKAATHGVQPEWRWHYRTVAAVIGWEAAKLLREGVAEEQDQTVRSRVLYEAAATLCQHGIEYVPLGVKLSSSALYSRTNQTVSSRVARTLSALSAIAESNYERFLSAPGMTPEKLWQNGFTSAALAWDSAQLLPNNSDETARILCRGGAWIAWDPQAADVLYKALVRRCRKTPIGAEADRLRWFPKLDLQGNLVAPKPKPNSPAKTDRVSTLDQGPLSPFSPSPDR